MLEKEFAYPAVFHKNLDGSYTVVFPDLPGCISEGKNLMNAIAMARKALGQWRDYLIENNEKIPKSSDLRLIRPKENETVILVMAS